MTLVGKRVVVTRAPHQAGELSDLLVARGAVPLLYPCIDIAPPENPTQLNEALERLSTFDWLILTSENTVHALANHSNATWPSIAAVGTATAQAVHDLLSAEVTFIPDEHSGESLGRTLPFAQGARILLPQSEIAPPTLAHILSERGAVVQTVPAYRTVMGVGGVDLPALLRVGGVDAITLTSASAARNFVQRLTSEGGTLDLMTWTACIGENTAKAARECGLKKILMPQRYSLVEMILLLDEQIV